MSQYNSIEKCAGVLRVRASSGWPRWFDVHNIDTGSGVTGMRIEEARDLYYMLGRIIAMAEEDDARVDRLNGSR